jgi:septum formation protein|tara:strand:+ start:154 stop:741 length:588 start_codon:yes stop_codon:yes gene_type:complete
LLILASASKARLELLESVGITPDKILNTNIDETPKKSEKPLDYVSRIALEKNKSVKKKKIEIVLTADTVVALGRRILQKPNDEEEALYFLNLLSGRRHKVYTSICIFYKEKYYQKNVKTTLKMKRLSDDEKKCYLLTDEWKGKAGGYSIQGAASYFFPFISGSYSNVVGLPLTETVGMLLGIGFKIPKFLNGLKN